MSAQVICCIHLLNLLIYESKEENSENPDKIADLGLYNCLSERLLKHFRRRICCDWRLKQESDRDEFYLQLIPTNYFVNLTTGEDGEFPV